MKALKPDDPILRRKCRAVKLKEIRTKDFQLKVEELLDFVYLATNKGTTRNRTRPSTVGLSANQVGLNLAVSVVDMAIGYKDFNDLHVLINPKIVWSSKTKLKRIEGCVNLDHVMGIVERSSRVKVEGYDRSGNKIFLDVHGWPAILMQHEIGHLNGELFIDLLPDPKKAFLVEDSELLEFKKAKSNWKKYIDVSNLTTKA